MTIAILPIPNPFFYIYIVLALVGIIIVLLLRPTHKTYIIGEGEVLDASEYMNLETDIPERVFIICPVCSSQLTVDERGVKQFKTNLDDFINLEDYR